MLKRSPTFEEVARAKPEFTTGFDYLRVGLALAVVVVHCAAIANPDAWRWMWTSWFGPIERAILPAFFALSGYLVAGSISRNTLPQFVALRAFRIVPALAVEVCITAFVLGALFTKLQLGTYFTSAEFYAYFLNVLGVIHYTLPGVFEGKQLNAQLWTIPFELECYALLVFLTLATVVRRKHALLSVSLAGAILMTAVAIAGAFYVNSWNVPGRMLVVAFISGVVTYLYKGSLKHNGYLALGSAVSAYLLLSFPNMVFLAAIPLVYLTVYVGLLRPPTIPFGDLSYGVYLFHFPVARALHEASSNRLGWGGLLLFTLGITVIFAHLSWVWVEKPVLDRKKHLLTYVDRASAKIKELFSDRHWSQCGTCKADADECDNCYLDRQTRL